MSHTILDFRSDTVTKPSPAMLQAMINAPVGDDVYDEDPTVNALQEKSAEMFGTEAALYCPSGTMTNQIALKVHTQPGDEVICHHYAHIYNYEGGGMMFNSGLSPQLIGDKNGLFTAAQAAEVIRNPNDIHGARTRLIEVENTSNKGGGTCYNFDTLKEIGEVAKANNLGYHLDGARIFNALVANKENPKDYGQLFDSISICLSKGLGSPIGSLILGSESFIREAKFIRKRFGGAWRQAGFMAAAGIYALDNNISRLAEDHEKAKQIETCLLQLDYVKSVVPVETNLVIFALKDENKGPEFLAQLAEKGIKISSMGRNKWRMVTHMDVDKSAVSRACQVLEKIKL